MTPPSPSPTPAADDAWAAVADVDGWMTRGQADLLFRSARDVEPGGTIVEIGSFQGRSTIVLAMAAGPGVSVIAIDPHAGNDRGPQQIDGYDVEATADLAAFRSNLQRAGVAERVKHIREFSQHATDKVDTPIDVLYIDGAHRYRPALGDIRTWGAKVRPGGTLMIHDAFSSIGVTTAIMRELLTGERFEYVERSRSLAVYRRSDGLDTAARVRNTARQAAQLGWFARNVALKATLTAGGRRIWTAIGRTPPEWPY